MIAIASVILRRDLLIFLIIIRSTQTDISGFFSQLYHSRNRSATGLLFRQSDFSYFSLYLNLQYSIDIHTTVLCLSENSNEPISMPMLFLLCRLCQTKILMNKEDTKEAHHQNKTKGDSSSCPFLARDLQFSCCNDIRDISRD